MLDEAAKASTHDGALGTVTLGACVVAEADVDGWLCPALFCAITLYQYEVLAVNPVSVNEADVGDPT